MEYNNLHFLRVYIYGRTQENQENVSVCEYFPYVFFILGAACYEQPLWLDNFN